MLTNTTITVAAALMLVSASAAMGQSHDPSIRSGDIATVAGSQVDRPSRDDEGKPATIRADSQFVERKTPVAWVKLTHLVGKQRKPLYLNVEQIVRIGDAMDAAAGYQTHILLTNGTADVFEEVGQVMQLILRANVSPPAES